MRHSHFQNVPSESYVWACHQGMRGQQRVGGARYNHLHCGHPSPKICFGYSGMFGMDHHTVNNNIYVNQLVKIMLNLLLLWSCYVLNILYIGWLFWDTIFGQSQCILT